MTSPTHADPAWQTQHGDREAPQNEILRTVVGSGVHGIAIEGTDDHDEMGVYVETPQHVLGLGHKDLHYVARTVPEGHRSQHGDTDLVLYSLRKYLGLVTTGNPTALLPLFAPRQDIITMTTLGFALRDFGPSLLSQQAGHRFLGYLHAQRQRLMGLDHRHLPARPELVEKYGYDVKYAAHAVRLGYQGVEVMRDGHLTLPLVEGQRDVVLGIKRGEWTLEGVLRVIEALADELDYRLRRKMSPLPERPNLDAANEWLVEAHMSYWRDEALVM
jgi:hypothetical protein